jgi:dTDP-4-amino-4,6-dideoxygalactose transaminase
VTCPTYTFFATAGCVARLGAEPVFADVDPATLNVTPEDVERAARRCRRLRAIVPVHLFGQAADLEGLEALAARLGVPILEDAAQAIGAADARGRRVGSAGHLAAYSFFPTKNLGGFGEGGLVTCHDADVADGLRTLRVHGMKPRYRHRVVGVNARLDALQAAVLRVKLPTSRRGTRRARATRATTRSCSRRPARPLPTSRSARAASRCASRCGRRRPRATSSTST